MSRPAQKLESVEIDVDDDDPGGLVGKVLGERFRVRRLLGVGGIGRVYEAEHLGLGRRVALKVLLEQYACIPELQRRFEREAAALSALRHPHIVTITDFVATPEVTFLVMELVEGPDLDDALEEGMATEDALEVVAQILSCLAYAHARGVIHRDLKPQNVLVRELPGGRVHAVVLDFGLAKFTDPEGMHANLTKTGLIVGTPAYMAPEQASGGRADARSDVYALGVLIYELLTGTLPFEGSQSEVLRMHMLRDAPTLAQACPGAIIAPELEALIARTLAKSPGDRYPDAGALLEAFLALPERPFQREDAPARKRDRAASTAHTEVALRAPGALAERVPAWAFGILGAVASAIFVSGLFFAFGGGGGETETVLPGAEPETDLSFSEQDVADEEALLAREAAEEGGEVPDDVAEPPEEASDPSLDEEADAPLDDEDAPPPEPAHAGRRSRARNPWSGRIPSTLAQVRRRVTRGQPITKRHIRQVARYRRSHPDDVRATLVLAHAYTARGWLPNALVQYRRAYRLDPSSRGDARMKRDLVRMAARESTHDRATDALIEIYGSEGRPLLRRAMASERDPADRRRLRETYDRLR